MRILLVRPPRGSVRGLESTALVEPLGLETLAGGLGMYRVGIADLRMGDRLSDFLRALQPQLCGIGCAFTSEARSALAVARQVKEARPDCRVVVGGQHASLWPVDFADPAVDGVVVGEGEVTLLMVARAIEGHVPLTEVPGLVANTCEGQVSNPKQAGWIEDLDLLPMPERRLLAPYLGRFYMGFQRPMALVETTRGCPQRCSFCAVWKFYGERVRQKSAERVAEELRAVAAPHVFFTDDNFLADVTRGHALADRIIELGIRKSYTFQARTDTIASNPDLVGHWAAAGPCTVFVGLERLTREGLRELRKGNTPEANERALEVLAKAGVTYSGNFMVDPQATPEDFQALREYVRARGLRNASFTITTPLPGTDLFEEMKGKLREGNCALYDLFHAVVDTALPREQFYAEFASLWQEVRRLQGITRAGSWRRLAGALLTRKTSMRALRRGMNVSRQLSNPALFLRDHEEHSQPLPPGETPRFT